VEPLLFIILFPFLVAIALLAIKQETIRKATAYIASIVILAASLFLLYSNFNSGTSYNNAGYDFVNWLLLFGELVIAVYIAYKSLITKRYLPLALILIQTAVLFYFESLPNTGVQNNLFIDQLSLIMAMITGVIGSIICVYSFSYMRDFHKQHKEVPDRRGTFMFLLFAFLGAMFGLIFSNNLHWLYFFWEVTSLCSFALIGYTRSHEAVENAFKALTINLIGGLFFILAVLYLGMNGILTLDGISLAGKAVLLPVIAISIACMVKSAQLPFSSWLVGAGVAPTPVSALLHSSTMVNAGVYLLIRFAPIFQGTIQGTLISLIGGLTFVLASAICVSQSNAKKVLAYSTIANLGLIVACAGVGSYEAIWAAILLIIFHSLAKSLMFMTVGSVEHRIGSKDIEDMESLVTRMPRAALVMIIGIAGMFLAPFGMLISKWVTLKAFMDADPLLVGLVALGSGITVFFWAKWLGKLVAESRVHKKLKEKITGGEWAALGTLATLTICMCLLFPLVSTFLVEPFVLGVYGTTTQLSQDNVVIMMMMLVVILVLPLSMVYYGQKRRHMDPYACGVTTAEMRYEGSLGIDRELTVKNYYLENMFGEEKLMKYGIAFCSLLIAGMFALMVL